MAESKAKVSKRKKDTFQFVRSAYEFNKAYHIMDLRASLGYSYYELSFLLGRDNYLYLRDVENPLKKLKYDPIDVNYLGLILRQPFSRILPPSTPEKDYQVKVVSYLNESRRAVYEISIKNTLGKYVPFRTFVQERKSDLIPTQLNAFSYEEVLRYINELLDGSFFQAPKTALEILDKCREKFGDQFHPREMIKVLNLYTNKKSGIPKLNKEHKNDFGRIVYSLP